MDSETGNGDLSPLGSPGRDAPETDAAENAEPNTPQLLDLIPVEELRRFQGAFSEAAGLPTVILDLQGRPVAGPSGSCPIRTALSGDAERETFRCASCAAERTAFAAASPPCRMRRCAPAGLLNAAAEIRLGGRRAATWLMGPARDEEDPPPAVVDLPRALEAWRRTPRLTQGEFARLCRMLRLSADHLAELVSRDVATSQTVRGRARPKRSTAAALRHDELTGLPDRSLCLERIRQIQRRGSGRSFSIIAIDLDGFAAFNNRRGRNAGDELLRDVSRRLLGAVRAEDTVARIDDDEFAVLLEGEIDPLPVVKRIQASLREGVRLAEEQPYCETSIGIETARGTADERPEDLLRNADMAMRQAKSSRRRIRRFVPRRRGREAEEQRLVALLPEAIRKKQFLMLFQPIVSTGEGTPLFGFEALMRWRMPGRGLLSPGIFIPAAERCGGIVELGRLALDRSCAFAARVRAAARQGRNCKICVNVSPVQLQNADIAADVFAALRRYDLPGESLVLEITETLAMRAGRAVSEKMERLRALGVGICVDDFGVGYSNISLLTRLAPDCIKIDMSLVRGIESSPQCRAVVELILGMSRALGFHVIAEGVERPAQLAVLRELRCPCWQGFLYAKPLAEAQALALTHKERFP